jgi:hypothetical protein
MKEPLRMVLAERAGRSAYVVTLEPDALRVAGVPCLPDRRIPLRDVYGIERAGVWLWVGAGWLPVLFGGGDVPAARLTGLETELRARIAALPDGARRLARIDARRTLRPRWPVVTLAGLLALGVAFGLAAPGGAALGFAINLLLLASLGLLAEPWLGPLRLLASAGAGALAAGVLTAGSLALAGVPLALGLGLAGTLGFARLRREPTLSVRFRSALEAAAPLVLAVVAHALATGLGAAALGAGLAGALLAPLLLRPERASARLH